jgi:hypothetical protein
VDTDEIKNILNNQNSMMWLFGGGKKTEVGVVTSYDSELFDDLIKNLNIINYRTKAENADKKILYDNGAYSIQNYAYVDDDNSKLSAVISNAINNLDDEIRIENTDCCTKLVSDEEKKQAEEACDKANKLLETNIKLNDGKFVYNIAKPYLANWINIDNDYNVNIDKEKINEYVSKWNTLGSTRDFLSSHGKYIKVDGGDYGWSTDTTGVADGIYNALSNGEDASVKISVNQWALDYGNNDIGNTYVEIDLTNQYLYLYVDGKIKVKTPVVTGLAGSMDTPQGVYRIKQVCRNSVLVGADYRTPVSYWIPFNDGIGLHDATWQYQYGGDWYKVAGSHGCVNLPLLAAGLIYNEVFEGMPVVCYYYDRLPEYVPKPAEGNVISENPGINSPDYKDYRSTGHTSSIGNYQNKVIADKKRTEE